MKEVYVFGFRKSPLDKYHVKWSITKKKAFNTFYKSKSKYFQCGVFVCRSIKDFQLIKYAEFGEEKPIESATADSELIGLL